MTMLPHLPGGALDLVGLAAILLALVLGGVMKGATGAGAPVVAVPVIAAFTDVRLAVLVMVVPNIATNALQLIRYRGGGTRDGLAWRFGLGGALGAIVGTFLLVALPVRALSLIVAVAVAVYVLLRVARPDMRLGRARALRWSVPAGLVGGVLQGAGGVSAPVSVSFVNAMRLERVPFIVTMSTFFLVMSLAQVVALAGGGLLNTATVLLSVAACVPLLAAMPLGNYLATKVSAQTFDRLILALLVALAARLLWTAILG